MSKREREVLISLVEHLDAKGYSPFEIMMELMLMRSVPRSEAVEIYRRGTLAWSMPGEEH